MKIRSVKYFFREAFKSLIRNRLMTVASVITVMSCVLMLIISYAIAVNVQYLMHQVQSSVGITCYLDNSISNSEVNALYNDILEIEHVKYVEYLSASDALREAKKNFGDDAYILEGIESDNPLPRSFTIETADITYNNGIVKRLEEMQSRGIEKISNAEGVAGILITINNVITIISVIVVVLLSIIAVLIIMNTIKLTVNSRKTEISIMKYVGATDGFIRWPFLIEGALIGMVGAILPTVLCWYSYSYGVDYINSNIPLIEGIFEFKAAIEVFPILIPVAILFGSMIGVLGSVTSMRRYLNV